MVTFNHPQVLVFAAFFIPIFLLTNLLIYRQKNQAINRYGNKETLASFSKFTKKLVVTIIITITLALLCIGIAQPIQPTNKESSQETLNAIIVLDVSKSMFANDGLSGQTRLRSAIDAIDRLLAAYPNGHFGLVIYTKKTADYQPTLDHKALLFLLRNTLKDDQVPGEGSNPERGLTKASKLLEDLPIKTIFFISDGGIGNNHNRAELSSTLEKLRSKDIKVVSVGIGGFLPSSIPIYNENGELTGYHMFQGHIAYTALEEELPRQVAEKTNGYYLKLEDPDDLVKISRSKNLDNQPAIEKNIHNLTWLPIGIALFLNLVWLFLTNLKIKFKPRIA